MPIRTLMGACALAALAVSSALAAPAYRAPRTETGQPDLQGNWTNATITPLTRPAKFGARNVLTPEEARAQEAATAAQVARADAPTDPNLKVTDLKNADCGADGISGFNCGYNQGWKDPGTTVIDFNGEKRASILTLPANGQFPAMTPAAVERMRARRAAARPYDGPEQRGLGERCLLSFGSSAGPPMLPLMYNNTYAIVQTRDAVLIEVEMVHDTRIVRLNAQHDPSGVKRWMGDSVGHFEGDTLVIETTDMRPEQGLRGGSPNQKVTEWLTRISPTTIKYRFRVEDPDTYAQPFEGEVAFRTTKGQVYEYACHEGNYAMTGILEGARMAEKEGRKPGGVEDGREEGSN
jgi:hypothetical protein